MKIRICQIKVVHVTWFNDITGSTYGFKMLLVDRSYEDVIRLSLPLKVLSNNNFLIIQGTLRENIGLGNSFELIGCIAVIIQPNASEELQTSKRLTTY